MLVIGAKKASSESRRKKKASLVLDDDGRGPGEAKRRKDSMNSITLETKSGSRDTKIGFASNNNALSSLG